MTSRLWMRVDRGALMPCFLPERDARCLCEERALVLGAEVELLAGRPSDPQLIGTWKGSKRRDSGGL